MTGAWASHVVPTVGLIPRLSKVDGGWYGPHLVLERTMADINPPLQRHAYDSIIKPIDVRI